MNLEQYIKHRFGEIILALIKAKNSVITINNGQVPDLNVEVQPGDNVVIHGLERRLHSLVTLNFIHTFGDNT